jgi:hypothetical protein
MFALTALTPECVGVAALPTNVRYRWWFRTYILMLGFTPATRRGVARMRGTGSGGPVIEAGLGAEVAVLSLLAAFVVTTFSTAGAAFGLPAVFGIWLLRAAGAVFLTVLT